MKVLSNISFLFVTIFAFTVNAQTVRPLDKGVYAHEPHFDEKTGEVVPVPVPAQGFRYTGNAAPTYDPRPPAIYGITSEIEKTKKNL